ncbi:MAG: histidinol dehydrogenase, partial [Deltaproteobacteria bacterium]
MLEVLKDGTAAARRRLDRLARRQAGGASVEPAVRRILESVRKGGDRALLDWTHKLDGVRLSRRDLFVEESEIDAAVASLEAPVRRALARAHAQIARFHRLQRERGFECRQAGLRTGMRVAPLARVGVYVPGGSAAYPSTV